MRRHCTHPERSRPAGGFTMIEVMVGLIVFLVAALLGSMFIMRSARETIYTKDRLFARAKAQAILAEVRALVRTDAIERAADLDGLDDDGARIPTLTITTREVEDEPLPVLVEPDHPISGNQRDRQVWRWSRSITVEPFGTDKSADRRLCTVRIYRHFPGDADPKGVQAAEASGVVQSLSAVHTAKQVLDVYVILIENVPAFWTSAGSLRAGVETALQDVEQRNPGLRFRVHWITRMGYGRDEEYAPHGNSTRRTDEEIRLVYHYPGRLPDDAPHRLVYSIKTAGGRYNLDVTKDVPAIHNHPDAPEIWYDDNGNGRLDGGESYEDSNGNDRWDPGNLYPYAFADMHNHAMRHPDALAKFQSRVHAGNEDARAPTLRLLLDGMVSEPEKYRNAIILNAHGSLLPMPPVRNFSDAASSPNERQGWRVVTHPEHLAPRRVAGDDAASVAPRFRIYAYKTEFVHEESQEQTMTLPEPWFDQDGSGDVNDKNEWFDSNGNKRYDAGVPITLLLPGMDLAAGANVDGVDSLILRSLAGGVDADGDGTAEPYDTEWRRAVRLPEPFVDTNGNGRCEVAEPYFDINDNGVYDEGEPFEDYDHDGVCTTVSEPHQDMKPNGRWDPATPAEPYEDANGNGRYDGPEPYWDYDGNGRWTKPKKDRNPPDPWNPAWADQPNMVRDYIRNNGEPYMDLDGDGEWDEEGERFEDINGNDRYDHGFVQGDMFFTVRYDEDAGGTVLSLYGTPLETPPDASGRGLDPRFRLYDYEYVPCPTPATPEATDRFGRDLTTADPDVPKNTARWTLEIPVASLRKAFESAPGANDGDRADRLIAIETRMGHDLTTGVMWPIPDDPQNYELPAWVVPNDPRYAVEPVWPFPQDPQNLSTTYAWFVSDVEDVPYSERYQFQGDPRHSPYADTDARGASFPHGYNWYFDDLRVEGLKDEEQPVHLWQAHDMSRMASGWAEQVAFDVPRYFDWMRTAIARSGAVYAHLSGPSFTHISLGGDVAMLDEHDVEPVPMDGTPFGINQVLNVNTLDNRGGGEFAGTRFYARCNDWDDERGLRDGGSWWAKPWLGELFPDAVYFEQWSWYGNLLAQANTNSERFSLMPRRDAPEAQLPYGMKRLEAARGETGALGITSFFNGGSPIATMRQEDERSTGILIDDGLDVLVEDGHDVGEEYGFSIPDSMRMVFPFGTDWDEGDDTNGFEDPPEWQYPGLFPRWRYVRAARYLADKKDADERIGSATIRQSDPLDRHHGRVIMTGIGRGLEVSDATLIRYTLLTLLNSYGKEGLPQTPGRIPQLPRVEMVSPESGLTLVDPQEIRVAWKVDWRRWDGRKYNDLFKDEFTESTDDLVYVPMVSSDYGETWKNALDGSWALEGELPLGSDGRPHAGRTLAHDPYKEEQEWTWALPAGQYPKGVYIIRIEAHRTSRKLHYAYRTERVDVER